MATTEERLQVLKMIEEGSVTPKEGAALLTALAESLENGAAPTQSDINKPRWFRVRVTDLRNNDKLIHISIPIGLVEVGLRMGAQFVPGFDQAQYATLLRRAMAGKHGKLLEHLDERRNERVEIFIE